MDSDPDGPQVRTFSDLYRGAIKRNLLFHLAAAAMRSNDWVADRVGWVGGLSADIASGQMTDLRSLPFPPGRTQNGHKNAPDPRSFPRYQRSTQLCPHDTAPLLLHILSYKFSSRKDYEIS